MSPKKKDDAQKIEDPPAVEAQGEAQAPPTIGEKAALEDQVDGDDAPQTLEDQLGHKPTDEDKSKHTPPNAQQTEQPGVIAGETAAETAVKTVYGEHRHDEKTGWDHKGPIIVDASEDPHTPNTEEKM